MKKIYTSCHETWGWIRTIERGIGPFKLTEVLESSYADTTREEASRMMYADACGHAEVIKMSTLHRKNSSTVVVKAPLYKATYVLTHWEQVYA